MPVKRRGGRRPGAGRPRSRVRALTREIANRCAEEGITPLEFMLRVMRDESADLQTRADMAKSAAPYIHPRLQAVEHAGWDGGPIKGEMKFSVSFEGEDDDDDLDSAPSLDEAGRKIEIFSEHMTGLDFYLDPRAVDATALERIQRLVEGNGCARLLDERFAVARER